jgi:ornithine cyclodeaminase/alanine dehydrogenase-like protein (mu-crystallin family)
VKDLPYVGSDRLSAALGMRDAIDALELAFGSKLAVTPDRSHLSTGSGDLLLMPAWDDSDLGVKLVTVAPGNAGTDRPLIQGVYILFEKESLSPIATFDASALTALRTAAVSGLATRVLADEEATSLMIFGAGVQARSHLEAMVAVRPIEKVRVISRTEERADELVEMAMGMGLQAAIGAPHEIASAQIVCTCTTSSEPVVTAGDLAPGAHINAVGSYTRSARELDDSVLTNARIVVDSPTALTESGDLVEPLERGVIRGEGIELLSDLVKSKEQPLNAAHRTVFKSVGAAFEDLAVARAAIARL